MNAYGHQSHQIEPTNNFELSPVSASEDDIEVVGARSNKNGDDVDDDDDDDPELKRRCLDFILCICNACFVNRNSFFIDHQW